MSQFDKAFKKVLLLDNYGFDFDVAIDKKYNIRWRQDGLGGSDSANWVPHDTIKNASRLIITEPWGGGTLTHYLEDAMLVHANAVSSGFDIKTWTAQPKILSKAIQNLGYRLRPQTVQYPSAVTSGSPAVIDHTWVNDGLGFLPNDYPRWNHKYAVAFALFSPAGTTPIQVVIDTSTNQGIFGKGATYPLSTKRCLQSPRTTWSLT